ncbi:DUF4221 domain-containing protein [Belliella sp. DSM 107340]|uniref:DUF4221 domain-containing protein n=1 Tax=Belliella calami TaxID=2923436 RepID=A0ABS9UP21_9BACT|nr:DUF4221 family protein [Belliella calami]MCH7397915.1 DUF4221 domain-containing protein [Belliella calami]
MKSKILLFFLSIILVSCTTNNFQEYTNNLIKVDSLRTKLPEYGNYSLSYIQIYENEFDTLLFAGNVINNSIDVFDLSGEKFRTRIEFQKNGPKSLTTLQGFYIINYDSILVFPNSLLHKSLIVGMDSNKIENLVIQDFRNQEPKIINHVSSTLNPVILNNSKLSFIQYPLFDVESAENINNEFDFEIIYDLKDSTISEGGIKYPQFYHGKIWSIYSTLLFRTLGENDLLVYSWSLSDSIYVKSISGEVESFIAKGVSHKKVLPFTQKPEQQERIKKTIESINYKGILYDKYRNLYYRVVLNSTRYDPKIHIDYKAFFDQQLSIITLDSSFNMIDETILDKNVYTYSSMFVGPKGLYISKANVRNNTYEEDYLLYDIFNLQR